MCDTIVALGSATKDGATLFGKNSDREPDEAQNLRIFEPEKQDAGDKIECTYMSVPRSGDSCRVLLCQPFWMYGAEMGANEHGVVIGNEALFTKEKPDPGGLLGMDILRLALERSSTARQALEEIIRLLEEYGQGGRAGYRQKIKYMNGFLIADAHEAYVLETVKKWWAWKRIEDIWSISNIISLEQDFDDCSPGLIKNAVSRGYVRSESEFSFRQAYSDRIYTWGAKGGPREKRSRALLEKRKGSLETRDFMSILRDHGEGPGFSPDRQKSGTICMHAANKLTRPSNTVCSLVAKLGADKRYYYSTGCSNPCMSPFYPVFFPSAGLPGAYVAAKADYDERAYWWLAEKLHRKALSRFDAALDMIGRAIESYEADMVSRVESGQDQQTQETVDRYFQKAKDLMEEWGGELERMKPQRTRLLYRIYWRGYNRLNRMPLE